MAKKTKQILCYGGASEEAHIALRELMEEEKIKMTPTSPMIYLFDGKALKYQIAKSVKRKYKKLHWLPVVFNAN